MRLVLPLALAFVVACTTSQKPAPSARIAKNKEGPASRKVRERQEKMKDELDFTLGDPVSPRVKRHLQDDRFTKSYGRPR